MPMPLKKCELRLNAIVPFLEAEGLLTQAGKALSRSNQDPLSQAKGRLRTDSRRVQAGDVFLAYKGVSSDGHLHLQEAVQQGAAFLLVEDKSHLTQIPDASLPPWVEVASGRAAWSALASLAFGHPEQDLTLLAVTGTNGKTSTVWLTAEILKASGIPCLTIGTLGARLGDEDLTTGHTTPDPDILYSLFDLARDRQVKVVAMEVSSHALIQEKVRGLLFAAGAWTSFSRDHLDFHPTMEAYWDAKWQLFTDHLAPQARCIFADVLPEKLDLTSLPQDACVYGFSAPHAAEAWGSKDYLEITAQPLPGLSTFLTLSSRAETSAGPTPFFARHMLENLAAAMLLSATVTGHLPPGTLLQNLKPVPGRLEPIPSPTGPHVVVDYAHTPDALEKTLDVLRAACTGRLIVVFGCGGDRDPGKRPLMGRIAHEKADHVFVTSDNPRTEDPSFILTGILSGIPDFSRVSVIADRAEAIEEALASAGKDDVVLIAGKGHESYQMIGTIAYDFDDRKVALGALSKKERQA